LLRIQQFQMSKFNFEQSFGRTLGVAYTALYRHLTKLMKENNLPITPDQFRVLTHLWQTDGLSQQELAVGSNRDRANVTRLIDILEREGIVERKDHENDRRVYKIYLTKKGKAIEEQASECAKQSIKDAMKGVTKEEIEICLNVLNRTIENLK
jgi:DNA-binding MarR family transcriptional regulator